MIDDAQVQSSAPEPAADAELQSLLQERDAACPGCGYNLRNLASGVCPECGLKLSVERLLQPAKAYDLAWGLALAGLAMGIPRLLEFVDRLNHS